LKLFNQVISDLLLQRKTKKPETEKRPGKIVLNVEANIQEVNLPDLKDPDSPSLHPRNRPAAVPQDAPFDYDKELYTDYLRRRNLDNLPSRTQMTPAERRRDDVLNTLDGAWDATKNAAGAVAEVAGAAIWIGAVLLGIKKIHIK
jgi:hypothetical protein